MVESQEPGLLRVLVIELVVAAASLLLCSDFGLDRALEVVDGATSPKHQAACLAGVRFDLSDAPVRIKRSRK